jgi:hypothetical protein
VSYSRPLLAVLVEVGRCFGICPEQMWISWTWPEVWGVYGTLVEGMGQMTNDELGREEFPPCPPASRGEKMWASGGEKSGGAVVDVGAMAGAARGAHGVGRRVVAAGRNWKEGLT